MGTIHATNPCTTKYVVLQYTQQTHKQQNILSYNTYNKPIHNKISCPTIHTTNPYTTKYLVLQYIQQNILSYNTYNKPIHNLISFLLSLRTYNFFFYLTWKTSFS